MKKFYIMMIIAIVTVSSYAQNTACKSNSTIVEAEQIVAIKENQIVSIDEKSIPSDKEAFRYYYLPNMYAYFDLKTNRYIYKVKNEWRTSAQLPKYYGGYSSFKNVRVPVKNYLGNNPQKMLSDHKKEFPYVKNAGMLKSFNANGNKAVSSLN